MTETHDTQQVPAVPYERPVIRDYGTLQDLTRGNTAGTGFDSSFSTDPCHGLTSMPMG